MSCSSKPSLLMGLFLSTVAVLSTYWEVRLMSLKIESLLYKLKMTDRYSFVSPPVQSFELNEIVFTLDNGILSAKLKNPTDTLDEARCLVDSVLKSWEALANIELPKSNLSFDIYDAKTINNNPNPDPNVHEGAGFIFSKVELHGTATAHAELKEYPTPPISFITDDFVDALSYSYSQFFEGKDKLLSMGYFCFTLLSARFGGVQNLKKELKISSKVVTKLSTLTSTKGDFKQARKVTALSLNPITQQEEHWICECIKTMTIRLGEYNSGQREFEMITMESLPRL